MEFIKVTTLEQFKSYEEDLDGLLKRSIGKNLYLTYDYIYSWLSAFGEARTYTIIIVKDGGKVVGFCPLIKETNRKFFKFSFSCYKFIGEGLWGYADFLADNDYRQEIIEGFLDYIFQEFTFHKIEFGPILENSLNLLIVRDYLERRKIRFSIRIFRDAPHIRTGMDLDEYVRTGALKKSTLDMVQRRIRQLSKMGRLSYRKINKELTQEELAGYMSQFLEMYRQQWKQNRFVRDSRFIDFYFGFAFRALKKGYCELAMLYFNDKLIAFHYGFLLDGCRYWFTPTYSTAFEYKNYSPGKVLLYYLVKDSFREKVEFDFMNGDEPYKFEWTKDVQQRIHVDIFSNNLLRYWFFYLLQIDKVKFSIARLLMRKV